MGRIGAWEVRIKMGLPSHSPPSSNYMGLSVAESQKHGSSKLRILHLAYKG